MNEESIPEWKKARETKKMFFIASAIIAVIFLIFANLDKIKEWFN